MIEGQAVIERLRRQFHGGALRRWPRKPQDAELLMALALTGLDAEIAYAESDINLHLIAWLNGIVAADGPDYVSLRRRLVDDGYLRRSSDGVIYRVQGERIDSVLGAEAKTIDVRQIFDAVEAERQARRQAFSR